MLLVEDDPLIRAVVSDVLEDEGYAVRVAPDGLAALEQLHADTPDLVVLDLMMPGMNGRQLLDEMEVQWPRSRVPVLLATAAHGADLDLVRDRVAALLPKPFDIDVLLDTVAQLIDQPGATDAVAQGESDARRPPGVSGPPEVEARLFGTDLPDQPRLML